MHLKFSLIRGVAFDGYSLKRGRLYEGWHLVGMALQKGDYSTSKKYISIENNNVNIFQVHNVEISIEITNIYNLIKIGFDFFSDTLASDIILYGVKSDSLS